ncbi:MAG: glycosyltransferase family 39 protein [Planctomycetes bacterium]|nr:glycosyltransferase family 39 protein [Planctomycetota bacterium]
MSARAERWTLVALFLASLAWNALGIGRLLPYDPEPDNYCAVQVAELEAGVPVQERMDKFRSYPLLIAALARTLPRFEAGTDATKAEHLRAASDVSLRARIVAVLLSSLLAPAAFLLARRFLPPWGALAAAAFAATSLLDQLFAAQGRPHGPLVALAALSVVAALRLLRAPGLGTYVLAGAAVAVATSTLQTGVFGLVSLVVAHRWVLRERRIARSRAWVGLGVAFALVLLAYIASRAEGPALATESGVRGTSLRIGSHYFEATLLNGRGFLDFIEELWMHDPVLLVLAFAGVALALPSWRRWQCEPATCVAGSYPLVYLGFWGFYGWTYDRYWLPLVPFLALLAAWILVTAMTWVRPRESALRRTVAVACVIAAFALPVWASVACARLRVAPDTIEEAAEWLEREVDPVAGASR